MTSKIIHGDCLYEMRKMADNSIDFICTDPPYGISFMSKKFDAFKNQPAFSCEYWKEALRICKPGSMLAAFGGDRTHHHLMNALEQSGWEIRTCVYWLFGSGFPKNHDISKTIDKKGGNPALIDEISNAIKESRTSRNLSLKECDDRFCNSSTNWSWFEGRPAGKHMPSDNLFEKICTEWPELFKYFEKVKDLNREIIPTTGNLHRGSGNTVGCFTGKQKSNIPISCLAEMFSGYGTALKPAAEIIVIAMKPLDGTFAQNAEKWGVAGINIADSRIPSELPEGRLRHGGGKYSLHVQQLNPDAKNSMPSSRWPSNLILSEESAQKLDQVTGNNVSRFFYCAKTSPSERQNSKHPTIKPKRLISYLVKLLAPPGNPICLDPFMGSGTCGVVCKELGIQFIGIEKELEYFEDAKRRVAHADAPQCDLFDSSMRDSQKNHSRCSDQYDESHGPLE